MKYFQLWFDYLLDYQRELSAFFMMIKKYMYNMNNNKKKKKEKTNEKKSRCWNEKINKIKMKKTKLNDKNFSQDIS